MSFGMKKKGKQHLRKYSNGLESCYLGWFTMKTTVETSQNLDEHRNSIAEPTDLSNRGENKGPLFCAV